MPARTPRRITVRKSSPRRRRAAAGNTARLDDGRIRRTGPHGPCGDGRPRWRGPRGSASAAGTRGSERVGGCSAGRCAYPCSRLKFSWSRQWVACCVDRQPACRTCRHGSLWCLLPTCGVVARSDDFVGARKAPAESGRPYEGTHPLRGSWNRPLDHGPRPLIRTGHAGCRAPNGNTPSTVKCLHPTMTCGRVRRLLAWPLSQSPVQVRRVNGPVAHALRTPTSNPQVEP